MASEPTAKKPTSFKAVSVNKTFLAAKAATNSAAAKPGDKAPDGKPASPATGSATLSAPRPRLVAKTGSALRDSTPRPAAANGTQPGAAPDASAVWNKNRPAPPPEPKRFTDEELKQQYGIHLATRLQSDDPKQANWADIDDDDEDWAPETIEWTDGTKITLPHADEAVPEPQEPAAKSPAPEEKVSEPIKPKSPVPERTESPKIRLGGAGGSGKGLVLKGVAEKPTLVAKPPGPPTPVKSPWAPLPPVDKVPPVTIEVPQQQQPAPRFHQRDPHGFDAMPPPPTKEIAADDFSRSWREGSSSSNRELFNSQSGRYEPVTDNRRGSTRGEGQPRQPAVLQRPSHSDHPEPSAAFQTHRAGGQESSYSRRRASSNVSGGSGAFGRRTSRAGQEMPPPHNISVARRGSLAAFNDSPPSPTGQSQGQRAPTTQPWQARASPVVSHPSPGSINSQPAQTQPDSRTGPPPSSYIQNAPPAIPAEDEIEVQRELQKKIMKEKREEARRRRQELEEKEEAEKRERIRLKLEAMGPLPENIKSKKAEPQKDSKDSPAKEQPVEPAKASISPPKPPVPEVDGEAKQYGMMKVHSPKSVAAAPEPKPVVSHAKTSDTLPNGTGSGSPQDVPAPAVEEQQPHRGRPSASWQSAQHAPDRFTSSTWAPPTAHPTPSRSVWGPPTNDKTLGNGTFNPELSTRIPDMHGGSSPTPGPIGPPTTVRANSGHYADRSRNSYASNPGPIAPPTRHGRRNPQAQAFAAAWTAQVHENDAARRKEKAANAPQYTPEQIEEMTNFKSVFREVKLIDGKRVPNRDPVSAGDDSRSPPAPWNAQQPSNQDLARQGANIERTGAEVMNQKYQSTWRPAQADGLRTDMMGPSMPSMLGNANMPGATSSPPVRQSKFFPTRDIRLEEASFIQRPASPSPPPPTMEDHPVYDGDISHPLVSLPRPIPVVKLPPAPPVLAPIAPPPKPKPISFAAAVAAPPMPAPTPLRPVPFGARSAHADQNRQVHGQSPGGWQDRIDSLMGRKSSPPKSSALAVDSASKNAFELPPTQASATVSLPGLGSRLASSDDATPVTKPMAEECFEEQEMGSLPPVRVPKGVSNAAWQPAIAQTKPLPRRFVVQATSSEPLSFPAEQKENKTTVCVMIPGMTASKSFSIPLKMDHRQRSNPKKNAHTTRGGTPRHSSAGHSRGARPKEFSPGMSSSPVDANSTTPSPTSNSTRGRGGHRGRGGMSNPWSNRHVSTPAAV